MYGHHITLILVVHFADSKIPRQKNVWIIPNGEGNDLLHWAPSHYMYKGRNLSSVSIDKKYSHVNNK